MWGFNLLELLPAIGDIISELIAGVVSGTSVALAALSGRIWKRRSVERRFPISGDYLSFYEDTENGERVVVASESTVSQRGDQVRIRNTTATGRSWTLEGRISAGGHVSGVYSADANYDEGVGSFYLRIDSGRLEGMWNGYDHTNKMTNSGRYWFKRKYKIKTRPYEASDLGDILHTSSNNFGSGYFSADQLLNDAGHFAIVASFKKSFCGYCVGYLLPRGQVRDFISDADMRLPDDVDYCDRSGQIGVIKTLAVPRAYRQGGIGTQLIDEAERILAEAGAECILVPAWRRGKVINIENILLQRDFRAWLTKERYWQNSCDRGDFECVARAGGCECDVVFYRKGRL